ncbi:helix-turn-helix domain-containing protein [Streptomyces sp. NBC_00557]|uniref:helix-turn-helix domain-containing protein n=1 Tax=Streptomyces sp. NBC_00557 TaxID=2975776 RepID=UPI002E811E51|nr:helix-turn-helix domain-containing protein [Streptomyces sp. NBC_00557]WUC35487.1 helix-turn-helix domain-containing protein [Streptomyces sp. NBC_00557]
MAEKKPNAAPRPIHGVRRSTTPSGVIHVRTYQSGQYVVVGNHLAQHRELSLTAIGLATHILSVPEGTPVDIRSLAERFPEGRDRIASALRELEAHGYLRRVREHTESGRLVTRTYAHHTPVAAPAPLRVAGHPAPTRRTGDRRLSAGTNLPAAPEEDDQPTQPDAPEPAPAPVVAPKPAATPEAHGRPRDPCHDKAVTLLAGLRRTDDRLILSRRDVDRLAPAVTAWFDSGATAAVIHHALTADLPAVLKSPARLLGYRLEALLPVPLPARPAPRPDTGAEAGAGRRRDPLQNCDGCDRAFRAPHPGRCRDCRAARTVPKENACAA